MIDCKFMGFDDASAVPVLHYVFSLSVGDIHRLGSAVQSSHVFKSCQTHIFAANERIFKQVSGGDALVAVYLEHPGDDRRASLLRAESFYL